MPEDLSPAAIVQRQLDAYNAHDLKRFVAEYAEDIQVFRPPALEPILSGRDEFARHYAAHRFNLTSLHARVAARIVCGNKVVDHEIVEGLPGGLVEVVVVYQISGAHIVNVWFH